MARRTVGKALGSIVALMSKVLGHVFGGESWRAWRTLLRALFEGLDSLSEDERALVQQLTGRTVLPANVKELWVIVGRRAGKSMIAALVAVWATCCRSYTLAPGEVGIFMIVAADRRQARVIKRYIAGLLKSVAVLEKLIARETADAIWLTNGLCIEIHTCSFRSLRGYTCIGACLDEICFWHSEDSANPDHEVLVALKAAMATVPEAILMALSSPYSRKGEPWRVFAKHFGQDDSERVVVVNAPTLLLNPTIEPDVIEAAYEDDPAAAAAEFGGEWRRDIESFLTKEAIEAVTPRDRREIPPMSDTSYTAFVDPSGGSADSMTLAIGHRNRDGRAVLDVIREVRAPFSPEAAVDAFVETLGEYRVKTVTGDKYAGEWPRERFSKHGVTYRTSDRTKSELYVDFAPLVNGNRCELLDVPVLRKQLESLERKTARSGKDSIDHPPRARDDVSNAVAGALVLAAARRGARVAWGWAEF